MPATMFDKRESKRNWDATEAAIKANIAPLPKVRDRARREACGASLRLFLETYFPRAFPRKWSDDHLEVIEKTQIAVLSGGLFCVAMPRGSGKTTIHQRAAMWAINYGYRSFVFLFSADNDKALSALVSIKTEYENNPLLFADFPEICYPIRRLNRQSRAAGSQHIDGEPTLINWTAKCAQLPQVVGSQASGARIGVGGITAASRGAQLTLPSGEVLRPSLLLVDDFQTRESAASPTQCKTRLDTITGDLLGMRGPGEKLSMLITATVIHQGDAADQLLDRKNFPEFHGTRKKLVYSWPADEKKWEEYAELRKQAFREDRDPTEADEYYLANREEMDFGAIVAWPERKYEEEFSAIQHAYNLRIPDHDAFEAEYQNSPVAHTLDDLAFLTVDQIAEKLSNRPKGELPDSIEYITAAIDVQGNSLWWMVVAWGAGFSGYVLDYGCFPEQGRRFYNQRDLPRTFATEWPSLSEEEAIYKALTEVVKSLGSRQWTLDGGAKIGISRILIDEGYKDSTIHLFCEQGPHRSLLTPAKGVGVKAGDVPMNERPPKKGEKVGWNWRMKLGEKSEENTRKLRHISWDANSWKTLIQERFATMPGGRGCLSISGDKSIDHRLFAQHMVAEFATKTHGRGRDVIEWTHKPSKPDNHWLDGLAMCGVGASYCGIRLLEKTKDAESTKTKMSLAEYHKRAQGR